jgi:hypothetical protein
MGETSPTASLPATTLPPQKKVVTIRRRGALVGIGLRGMNAGITA